MKDRDFFKVFPPVSTEAWEEKINTDLKGADYAKKLIWKTNEGFSVKPYYRAEDLEKLGYLDVQPAARPWIRGKQSGDNSWEIRQDIVVNEIEEANKKALEALNKGATSIGFVFNQSFDELKNKLFNRQEKFSKLLEDIYFECIDLNFEASDNPGFLLLLLEHEALNKKIDLDRIIGSVNIDPLGELTRTGNFSLPEKETFSALAKTVKDTVKKIPDFSVVSVNGHLLHNSGSSIVEELGYALSMGNEYLHRLTEEGISVDNAARTIRFNFAAGGNYFMEIAKFRAARLLWSKIVEAYQPGDEASTKMYIHSETSGWNKTLYDPYVNLLRTTTESMSAVLAGVDSHTVRPFDAHFRSPAAFPERIARNQQIILKEEAYLDKIVDPAAGSYYIENLTDSIAEEAWKLFVETEAAGGYTEAFKKGLVQDRIEATAQKRDMHIAQRREILLGTNQYPNSAEEMADQIEDEVYNDEITLKEETIGRPLRKYRGASAFEKLRLATEKSGKKPEVFLLTYGNPAMRKARATFSSGFFACAGFSITDNIGFDTVEAGIEAAKEAQADIVVVCSSDEEYADIVPVVYEQLKDQAIVVVAGAPACMDELKNKGIENFIHVKSNVLETLTAYQKALGI